MCMSDEVWGLNTKQGMEMFAVVKWWSWCQGSRVPSLEIPSAQLAVDSMYSKKTQHRKLKRTRWIIRLISSVLHSRSPFDKAHECGNVVNEPETRSVPEPVWIGQQGVEHL